MLKTDLKPKRGYYFQFYNKVGEMKLGSKYDLLNTPCILKYKQIYWNKYLQSVEKIQWVDFTKYALSIIIN